MKCRYLAVAAAMGLSCTVNASTVLDFSDSSNLGVLGTSNLNWLGDGGGHLVLGDNTRLGGMSFENIWDGSYDVHTYLHSIDLNMLWGPNDANSGGAGDVLSVNVLSLDPTGDWMNNQIALTTINVELSYQTWDTWLTVILDLDNVIGLNIGAPSSNPVFYNDIYPSIDNVVVTQTALTTSVEPVSTVPVPAAAWLLGSGLLGLLGVVRRRKIV